ncbi:MAG: glycosyltransferase family 4 protein [Acidobacteria bacterium]|nr:glycosyltransferase family 4 protein [Acidobacteriota bacterium]
MIPLYVDLEREWRGGQNQALLTLRELRARGHAAELVAVGECPLARRAQAEGIPVHAVGPQARRLQAALLLRRLLTQRRFDLLHANEPHALTAAWLARAHHRLPLVASRRVAYALQRNSLALARYRAARRILTISRFVAESVVASGLPASQVEIVYEGVEVPPLPSEEAQCVARRRWGVGEDETLVGCVGYLLPEKGQRFLIRALPAVREHFPNCRLLLAGHGPCRARLGNLVRDLQLESAVHFAGFVEDVAQVYAALDLFVFPSLAEPLGTSLVAAMAYGLPVVAVNSGGVPEYVTHGQTGLLVSAANPNAIAAAVTGLLRDPEQAHRLGGAARETIEQRFAAGHMVENTLRAYERLCAV